MKITDLLLKNVMIMDLKATRKKEAIDEMVDSLAMHNRISDSNVFKKGIMDREAQTSTGLGDGIAMPHAKNSAVNEATVLFAKSSKGVNYEALDGQPTYLFFMIAAPEGANDTHLQALASLARLLVNPDFVASLKNAHTPEEVQSLFENAEKERLAQENKEQNSQSIQTQDSSRPFVIAVTACPTGIAHTYMAEDALKKKAAEMNIDIKVETNG
ncbi:MAG: fructose PTS transporter subunit IIA, partial [Carnobacterium sp.]